MLQKINLNLQLFLNDKNNLELARSRRSLIWLLEGMCKVNQGFLEHYPTPLLYKTLVVYQRETKTENWQDIPTVLSKGYGDCEDLACWRVAELRQKGHINARPYITWKKGRDGRVVYHVTVLWPDGRIEDPSKALGMNGRQIVREPVFI